MVCARLKATKEMRDNVPSSQYDTPKENQKSEEDELEEEQQEREEEENQEESDDFFDEYSFEEGTTAPKCALCGVTKDSSESLKLFRCTRCLKSYYCSREHQRTHWKAHKYICGSKNEMIGSNPISFFPNITDKRFKPVNLDLSNVI